MTELSRVPYARPAPIALTRCDDQYPPVRGIEVAGTGGGLIRRRTDGFAVASAICGMTAIIPVLSQVIGLCFGVISLVRIRRARRLGNRLGGAKWAAVGMVSSGFALVCWIGIFVVMGIVNSSLSYCADSLNTLFPVTP